MHGRRKALYTIFGGAFGIRRRHRAFDVRHRRAAQDVARVAHGDEVGGRRLSRLARHPGVALAADRNRHRAAAAEPRAGWSLFRQGALSALTNPKGVLFFAAFLPQFIDPARSLVVQFVIMAGTFAVIEIATELFIASMAHRISPWLRRVGRRFNQACGGVFVAIGVALPLRN